MSQKEYYNSITLLKVYATFLITWFHLKPYTPEFLQPLFIGGALGNSLFFFASGFLIRMKKERFIGEWMFHKYIRIMPSVWIATMLTILTNKSVLWYEWIYPTHFWFVNAIICFFFIYWCFHQWIDKNPIKTILVVVIMHVLWYLIRVDHSTLSLDGHGINIWFYNFIFFLSGHYIARYSKNMDKNPDSDIRLYRFYLTPYLYSSSMKSNFCLSIICVVIFFSYKILCKHYPELCLWQFLVMPITLFLFTIYTYKFMNNLSKLEVPYPVQHILSYISNHYCPLKVANSSLK